jgi:hypothetical protein
MAFTVRPTVTVRPSGSGMAPHAASTTAACRRRCAGDSDGGDQFALRSKERFDKPFDLAHERTNASARTRCERRRSSKSRKRGLNCGCAMGSIHLNQDRTRGRCKSRYHVRNDLFPSDLTSATRRADF